MYVNKCTKCGTEFETKNPKRVICPGCLYPDKQDLSLKSYDNVLKQPENNQETPQKVSFTAQIVSNSSPPLSPRFKSEIIIDNGQQNTSK